jgi:hypothetical protein
MTLQDIIDSASPGSTINVTQDYSLNATLTINKPLTLVGRQDSSGVRPVITITTSSSANIGSIDVNASNVTLKGLEIVLSNTNANIDQGAIRMLAGSAADFVNYSSIPVNENLVVDDCRIVYPKNCIYVLGNSISVTNCELHSTVTTSTTIRCIFFYHNNGQSVISNNVFTTAGGLALSGIYAQHNGSNGYRNTHSGRIDFHDNTCAVAVTARFVHLQGGVGSNNPAGSDPLSMKIYNNSIAGNTTSFLLYETNSPTSLEAIGQVEIYDNTLSNAYRDGVVRIARTGDHADFTTFTNNPKFVIFNNTEQTITNTSSGIVLENVLALTGYTTLPANISSILSTSQPAAVLSPGSQTLLDVLLPLAKNLSTTTDASEIIGLGSPLGVNVTLKKKSNVDSVISETHTISSLQHRLVLLNASSIPSNIGRVMAVFGPETRAQIESKNVVLQFAVKFVNNTTNQYETNLHQEYRIELPTLANRQYVKIYREGSDGVPHFITNANASVSGSSSNTFYTFNLESNSLYSVVDSGVFVSSAGIGSDPHITTFSGKHSIMHSMRGKNREVNILGDRCTKMVGHIQGYPNGDFLNKVRITHLDKSVCEIDFHKRRVNISNNRVAKVIENTNSQLVGNSNNSNRGRQTLFLDLMNPGGMYLYIDWNTRYVCPIFNQVLQNQDLKGVLI